MTLVVRRVADLPAAARCVWRRPDHGARGLARLFTVWSLLLAATAVALRRAGWALPSAAVVAAVGAYLTYAHPRALAIPGRPTTVVLCGPAARLVDALVHQLPLAALLAFAWCMRQKGAPPPPLVPRRLGHGGRASGRLHGVARHGGRLRPPGRGRGGAAGRVGAAGGVAALMGRIFVCSSGCRLPLPVLFCAAPQTLMDANGALTALLERPDRAGWRTHAPAWTAAAAAWLAEYPDDAAAAGWRRLAAAVEDAVLLRPALAVAVPLDRVRPTPSVWRPLWTDVQHALLAGRAGADRAGPAWLGALVLWLRRQRGHVVPRRAAALARGCPRGALALALDDAAWRPADAGAPGEGAWWRARAVALCWAIDGRAVPAERAAGLAWLAEAGRRAALTETLAARLAEAGGVPP